MIDLSNATATARRPTVSSSAGPAGSLRPRRRPWLLVAGLLAMVVSAGAFALLYLGSDARIEVLVVARPVAAGQQLTAADVRTARIVPDAGMDVVPAADASTAVGHTATVPLAPGSLLAASQLGPGAWPPKGQAVVAVPLKSGRLADGVVAGVHVLVIPVAAASPDSTQVRAVEPLADGTVVAVAPGTDGTGTTVVSLLVAESDAATVAGSGADLSLAATRG